MAALAGGCDSTSSSSSIDPSGGVAEKTGGLSGLSCPGSGWYCGSDGVQGGDAATVYDCPGAGQAPTASQACAAGCVVKPPGVNDYCGCFAGGKVEGVDVSVYQGGINWQTVAASGIGFAITRVGEGTNLDPTFNTNWQGIKAAGLVRGVYQYFYAGIDGATQADFLLSHIGTLGPKDLPPVLDVEGQDNTSFSGATIAAGVAAWRARVKQAIGREPLIYTGTYYWNGLPNTSSLAGTDLWVAAYGVDCPGVPRTWRSFRFWQYSSTGAVPGISGNVDRDRFDGTAAQLLAYANGGGPTGGPTVACPGAGDYCGADGVKGGDPHTLYHCPGAGQAPSSSTACASGCSVQPPGTNDFCQASGVMCPGAGDYCGSDGVQGGDANTLYHCPGASQPPSSSDPCAHGCSVQPAGTNDYCSSGMTCPTAGDYCGRDAIGGAADTLYHCTAAGQPPSSSEPCANGCHVEPAGTNDSCTPSLKCPTAGDYCGNDGMGGAANILYHCDAAGAAPSSSQACANGCSVQPAGTNDLCAQALKCPTAGDYCGNDGVGGPAGVLYHCTAAGAAPISSQACANGCSVQPAGINDFCNASLRCPTAGDYCGSDGVGGPANVLYHCSAAGAAPASSQTCAGGCSVQPAGTSDYCMTAAKCPGAGDYCGNDGLGGSANVLYHCAGAGQSPTSSEPCSGGCAVQPPGVNDYCNGGGGGGSCNATGGSALRWEAGQLASGNSWSDLCLGFVNNAFAHAGNSPYYLHVYSAAVSLAEAAGVRGFHGWGGSCPCGAIIYWAANPCNAGYGHVAICNGDGTASTSGWPGFGGGAHQPISWLERSECGHAPSGWIVP